jgi:SAM-dependent methyltransferase
MRPPELWEKGCESDPVRNGFVVPFLSRTIEAMRPKSVVDIGCGTGYMTRKLASLAGFAAEWKLLDCDDAMLRFAEAKCEHIGSVSFHKADLLVPGAHRNIGKSHFGFVAYSLLDIPLNPVVAANLSGLISASGAMVLFLPDVLEDVIQAATADGTLLREYLGGRCSIAKEDKFTHSNVLFEANRIEHVITSILATGFCLTELLSHETMHGKFHFGITFSRVGRGT